MTMAMPFLSPKTKAVGFFCKRGTNTKPIGWGELLKLKKLRMLFRVNIDSSIQIRCRILSFVNPQRIISQGKTNGNFNEENRKNNYFGIGKRD